MVEKSKVKSQNQKLLRASVHATAEGQSVVAEAGLGKQPCLAKLVQGNPLHECNHRAFHAGFDPAFPALQYCALRFLVALEMTGEWVYDSRVAESQRWVTT